jgi:hypothetical protein
MSKLIEKEGKHYIKGKVVMLATNEESRLYKMMGKIYRSSINYKQELFPNQQNQHLYITSNDEIKEGDFYYDPIANCIRQCEDEKREKLLNVAKHLGNKKIIATTDTSLKIITGMVGSGTGVPLPQPSESFIKAYIEAYNNGNVIEDILIEVEEIIVQDAFRRRPDYNTYRIKLKDNNIIIGKVKDSWTREEVHSLMMEAWIRGEADKSMDYTVRENWIEENL